MLAVDTNVFVRLIAGDDDPKQAASARALIQRGPIWVSRTVLLETNWVLESVFKFTANEIRDAFVRALGMDGVQIEDPAGVAATLNLTLQGVGFADALHLAGSPPGIPFVTFDRAFIRRAKRAGVTGISEPADHLSR